MTNERRRIDFHIAFVVLWIESLHALVVDRKIKFNGDSSERLIVFQNFQFLSGGTVDLNFELSSDNLDTYFLLCNLMEINKMNQDYGDIQDLCDNRHFLDCSVHMPLYGNTTNTLSYTIQNKNSYFFLFENCREYKFEAKLQYTLLNPGNEHLGFNLIPLPTIYMGLVCVCMTVYSLWLINWYLHRKEPWIPLHTVISAIPILKGAELVLSHYHWKDLSDVGMTSDFMDLLRVIVGNGGFHFYSLTTILLIAHGWCITVDSIPRKYVMNYSTNAGILCSLIALNNIYQGYYALLLIFAYFITYRMLFMNLTRQITILNGQLVFLEMSSFQGSIFPILARRKLFDSIRTMLMSYVFGIIMINITGVFLFLELAWVTYTARELLDLFVIYNVMFLFRLQNFSRTDESQPFVPLNSSARTQLRPSQDGVELSVLMAHDPFANVDAQRDLVIVRLPTTGAANSTHSNMMIGRVRGNQGPQGQSNHSQATDDIDSDEEIGLLNGFRSRRR